MVKNYKNVKVKVSSGGIRTITIDHPKTYNSLSFETLRSLLNIFKEHPVSLHLSLKINDLIEFAIRDEIILIRVSFLLSLNPPTRS